MSDPQSGGGVASQANDLVDKAVDAAQELKTTLVHGGEEVTGASVHLLLKGVTKAHAELGDAIAYLSAKADEATGQ